MVRNFIIKLKNKPMGPIYFSYKKHIFTILSIYKVNILKNNLKNISLISTISPISYKKLDTQLYSYILSTPKGLVFHEDAIKFKVGGFIICKFI
jgi:ribosomal protein S8